MGIQECAQSLEISVHFNAYQKAFTMEMSVKTQGHKMTCVLEFSLVDHSQTSLLGILELP